MNDQNSLKLQPMIHVENMSQSVEFYEKLGAKIISGSRDGDWVQMSLGGAEIGLLAHPANPEQNEGQVELNFESTKPLEELQADYEKNGIKIARGAGDEAFGAQLQIESPDGMLIKINKIDPSLYAR
jgi:predicted lactoylglutathione lyase